MSNLRFIFGSKADDITLSATSGTIANVQTPNVRDTWQSGSLSDQTISGTFSGTHTINAVHLKNINAESATYTFQLSDDNFSSTLYDENFSAWGDALAYQEATHWLTSDITGTDLDFRLIVSDSGNSDGFMEIGRLIIGQYYEAENSPNVSPRKTFDYRERSDLVESLGGAFRAMEREPQRVIGVEYEFLHDDDLNDLDAHSLIQHLRQIGGRKDVLISVYPDEDNDRERLHTVLGRITRNQPIRGDAQITEGGVTKLLNRWRVEVTETL